MSGILGTLIVLGVCGYLGFYLWQASWDSGPDAQAIYDDLILRDYEFEQGDQPSEVQPASDQDEGTGERDREVGEW